MGTEGLKKAAESVSSVARGFEFFDFESVPEVAKGRGWRIKLEWLNESERPTDVFTLFKRHGFANNDKIHISFEHGHPVIQTVVEYDFVSLPPQIQQYIKDRFYSVRPPPPVASPSGSGERRIARIAPTEVSEVTEGAQSKIAILTKEIEGLAPGETLAINIPPADREHARGSATKTINGIVVALQQRMSLVLNFYGTTAEVTHQEPEELDIEPDSET